MANRAYLCGIHTNVLTADASDAVELLEARYCLPLLWLSLFQRDDVRVHEETTLLLTSREQAIDNWVSRKEGISRFVGAPSHDILTGWEAFIRAQNLPFLLVDAGELAFMDETEGQFRNELGSYFSDLDEMCRNPRAARDLDVVVQANRSLCSYPYTGDALPLCGYSFSLTVPWPNDTAPVAAWVLNAPTFLIEELDPAGQSLQTEVQRALERAGTRDLRPFACISANWCTPCLEMFELFADARLAPVLNGIHLLKLDYERWEGQFGSLGIEEFTSVPHLVELNQSGTATGRSIDGDAWGESTPDELSRALGPFFQAEAIT